MTYHNVDQFYFIFEFFAIRSIFVFFRIEKIECLFDCKSFAHFFLSNLIEFDDFSFFWYLNDLLKRYFDELIIFWLLNRYDELIKNFHRDVNVEFWVIYTRVHMFVNLTFIIVEWYCRIVDKNVAFAIIFKSRTISRWLDSLNLVFALIVKFNAIDEKFNRLVFFSIEKNNIVDEKNICFCRFDFDHDIEKDWTFEKNVVVDEKNICLCYFVFDYKIDENWTSDEKNDWILIFDERSI